MCVFYPFLIACFIINVKGTNVIMVLYCTVLVSNKFTAYDYRTVFAAFFMIPCDEFKVFFRSSYFRRFYSNPMICLVLLSILTLTTVFLSYEETKTSTVQVWFTSSDFSINTTE